MEQLDRARGVLSRDFPVEWSKESSHRRNARGAGRRRDQPQHGSRDER
jgi:hypothetical protein